MSLLVTGSIGIDTVKTPGGIRENCLGGAAIYFSMAASFFSPVRFVGVIGSDCPFDLAKIFAGRNVDLTGLELRPQSKTFRWTGSYHENMDDRTTEKVELNVLAEAPPKVPEAFKDSEFVFLANTAPALQHELLGQIEKPAFVAVDTMDLWIREYQLPPTTVWDSPGLLKSTRYPRYHLHSRPQNPSQRQGTCWPSASRPLSYPSHHR